VGTATYCSPEQLAGGAYDEKSDMYSLGMMLIEMYMLFQTGMVGDLCQTGRARTVTWPKLGPVFLSFVLYTLTIFK
jgi:serine/threonine protein kinase